MNKTEKYYKRWLKDIAKTTSPRNIKGHITHHTKQLYDTKTNNPVSWVASMYNLLKIYELVHRVESTTSIQIYKLLKKYNKNPRTHTPPPGNKITKNVKIKKIPGNIKK